MIKFIIKQASSKSMQNIMFFLFKIMQNYRIFIYSIIIDKVYLICFYKQFLRKFIKIKQHGN